jgi:hypothetical protein
LLKKNKRAAEGTKPASIGYVGLSR